MQHCIIMPYHTIDSTNWRPKDDAVIPRWVTIKNCACGTVLRNTRSCDQCSNNKSKSALMVDKNIWDSFEVSTGVLQDDVLAPFLFIFLVDFLMKKATADLDRGVLTQLPCFWRYPAKVLNDLYLAGFQTILPRWNPLYSRHRLIWLEQQTQQKISAF